MQGVLAKNDVDEETFKLARSLTQESSVIVTGEVRADERSPSGVELGVTGLELIAQTEGYPITPKEHGVDFLMEHRHLYLRNKKPWAIMRIRDELERAVHDFFAERGFVRFDTPFFTPNAAEGTTNLFEIDLFGEDKAYLSQSGQLYAEAGALAFGPSLHLRADLSGGKVEDAQTPFRVLDDRARSRVPGARGQHEAAETRFVLGEPGT